MQCGVTVYLSDGRHFFWRWEKDSMADLGQDLILRIPPGHPVLQPYDKCSNKWGQSS
jgi:hypothetical protein